MPGTFRLQIVTPERVLIDGPVTSLVAPGTAGSFGVLPGHAPLVTELDIGELRYRDETGTEHVLAIHGGFVQVTGDRTTVLADAAERPGEINVERARQAEERAREEQRVIAQRFSSVEEARVQAAIQRALLRLRIARRG